MPSLHVITASTSGHTDYVADVLEAAWKEAGADIHVSRGRAELAAADDLLRGDALLLGSGTWNTGGIEGQLNMHMHALLQERAKDLDLAGKPIAFVSLGDERYYFRTRCIEYFLRFQREHHGVLLLPPLVLVNEPYGQEEKIHAWGMKLAEKMRAIHP